MPAGQPRAYRAMLFLALALMVGALLLGGATREGDVANALVRLLSLPVLVLALGRLGEVRPGRELLFLYGLLAAILAVPLLQLIPLPPGVWTSLPGRETFAEGYRAAGMALPSLPLSLSRDDTVNAALALLPGAAMFLAVATLDERSRRLFIPWILAVVALSVILGMAQIADGRDSALRLYVTTNASAAVGFFANRNHQAALLVTAVPLVAVWIRRQLKRGGRRQPLYLGLGLGLGAALVAGIAVADSRAGLMLIVPALAGALLIIFGARMPRLSVRLMLAVGVALVLGVLLARMTGMFHKMADLPPALQGELRLQVAPTIIKAALEYTPFGSGLGTFDPVYRMLEEVRSNAFLNHAHNDYLEIWLETGVFGPLLLSLFLGWFTHAATRAWRRAEGNDLSRGATVVIGLLLVHSLVDYPLRTAAMSVIFAYACGCLVRAPVSPQQQVTEILPPSRRSRRRLPREA
jgi:O-antigen ligase